MQTKMLKLGTALTVACAFLNATTAPAAAGGYGYSNGYNAALINHYIQQAPWTGYGSGHGYKSHGYKSHDYGWKSYDYGWKDYGHKAHDHGWKHYDHGYKPHQGYVTKWVPKYDYYYVPKTYVSTLGHGVVTYYDDHGGHAYYGEPAFAKRTTIVHPTVKPYGKVHAGDYAYDHGVDYGDHDTDVGHDLHVGKHATDVRNPVFFASGSSTLDYAALEELKEIGKVISAYYFGHPDVLILLSGFTDATGSAEANEALSKARNQAVKDYLVQEFGFDHDRFVLRAVGEDYAAVSDADDDSLRKVVVSLVGLPKSATDQGHEHEETPAMADGGGATPALDKGELAPDAHAMVDPEPAMKPMPKPAATATMKPATYAGHMKPVTRCYVPSGPYKGTYVDGKLLATLFTDIDDYGGGKLEEVCGLSY